MTSESNAFVVVPTKHQVLVVPSGLADRFGDGWTTEDIENAKAIVVPGGPVDDTPIAGPPLALTLSQADVDALTYRRGDADQTGHAAATHVGAEQDTQANEGFALAASLLDPQGTRWSLVIVADGGGAATLWPARSARIASLIALQTIREFIGRLEPADDGLGDTLGTLRPRLAEALREALAADRALLLERRATPGDASDALDRAATDEESRWYDATLLCACVGPKSGFIVFCGDGALLHRNVYSDQTSSTDSLLQSTERTAAARVSLTVQAEHFQLLKTAHAPNQVRAEITAATYAIDRSRQVQPVAPSQAAFYEAPERLPWLTVDRMHRLIADRLRRDRVEPGSMGVGQVIWISADPHPKKAGPSSWRIVVFIVFVATAVTAALVVSGSPLLDPVMRRLQPLLADWGSSEAPPPIPTSTTSVSTSTTSVATSSVVEPSTTGVTTSTASVTTSTTATAAVTSTVATSTTSTAAMIPVATSTVMTSTTSTASMTPASTSTVTTSTTSSLTAPPSVTPSVSATTSIAATSTRSAPRPKAPRAATATLAASLTSTVSSIDVTSSTTATTSGRR